MRIVVCGPPEERRVLIQALQASDVLYTRQMRFSCFDQYDAYVADLRENPVDVVIVLLDGAEGMEWVYAAKAVHDGLPVIWISDSGAFCPQSYRLDVYYFCVKPMDPTKVHKLASALNRCSGMSLISSAIG